jgi:rhamnogalacturonyl hydrolase YesR
MKYYINKFLLKDNLATYDPYDIWKTNIGVKIKSLFYKNKYIGGIPAGLLSFYDLFINNNFRIGYKKQEYPIVRAQAALILLNLYKKEKKEIYLKYIEKHLKWLIQNSSKGYNGYCWGLSQPWMSKNGFYDINMPHVTHMVYVLEAFVEYNKIKKNKYINIIKSVFDFLEKDIKILNNDKNKLALSYAPIYEPRIVINANSYTMYMYSMLLEFFPEKKNYIVDKINKIYNFIIDNQEKDGSWYYYADNKEGNFIDCFHSCFVLKNIYKTSKIVNLKESDNILKKGVEYILKNFYDGKHGLFRRFVINDKPTLIKYDLYDNAEVLNILKLLKYKNKVIELEKNIRNNFIRNNDIYSQIDIFGIRRNRNMLRWAVLPYLLAKTQSSYDEEK